MDVDGEPEAWDGWEVDSDSDESSSASEGWIDVSSDEEDIVISDSEDENEETREKDQEEQLNLADVGTTKVSLVATLMHSVSNAAVLDLYTRRFRHVRRPSLKGTIRIYFH